MPSRTIYGSLNGLGEFWSNDPNGTFFNGVKQFSTTLPTVSLTSSQDTLPAIGSTVTCTFSSSQPGFWEIASNVPGATISEAIDGLSAVVTFVPQAYPVCSIYVAARCVNAGGSGIAVARVHPGMRGVIRVGSGWDYSTLTAAFAAVKAFSNPGGYAFVIKNGTYTDDNMHIFRIGTGSVQTNMPPCGEFTVDTSGADPVYTITRFTTVMAETPFGVIFDGQGTRGSGIELYGNTAFESDAPGEFGTSWHLSAAGTQMRGIHLAGFVTDDALGGGWISYYCDHIFYEYGFCGRVARLSPNSNTTCIQFQNSTDCVMENMHSIGSGRYKHSNYQSKRLAHRRLFGRFDELGTSEPHGGMSMYRSRYTITQNALYFDSDQLEEFDTSRLNTNPDGVVVSQDVGILGFPSTGAFSYPRDAYVSRVLGFNNRLGFIENDAREITEEYWTGFVLKDIGHWYYKPTSNIGFNNGSGAGCGLCQDGPIYATRLTSAHCDNIDSAVAATAFRKPQTYTDSVIYRMGYEYDGAGRGLNTFAYAEGVVNQPYFVDTTIYDLSVATEISAPSGGVTYTNVDRETDPTTQGMRYPGRLEPSSNYELIERGQDNFFLSEGRRGAGWGMAGDKEEVNDNWMAQAMLELVLPHYRNYSHTGPTITQGTQTLSGNRGGAMVSKFLPEYVISMDGRDVPFPLSVRISKTGVGIRVSWRVFSSAFLSTITEWRIYLDGSYAETTAANIHSVDFNGLISGREYKLRLQAIDSVHGASGFSYEFKAVA